MGSHDSSTTSATTTATTTTTTTESCHDSQYTYCWNSEDSGPFTTPVARVSQVFAILLLTLLCLASNTLLIFVVLSTRCRRSVISASSLLLINLAAADLLVGSLVLPMWMLSTATLSWPLPGVVCDITAFCTVTLMMASILSLAAIAVDRYLNLAFPLRYPTEVTPRRLVLVLVMLWSLCLVVAGLPLAGWGKYMFQPQSIPICNPMWVKEVDYAIVLMVCGLGLPFLIMLAAYIRVMQIARRHLAAIEATQVTHTIYTQRTRTTSPPLAEVSAVSPVGEGPGANIQRADEASARNHLGHEPGVSRPQRDRPTGNSIPGNGPGATRQPTRRPGGSSHPNSGPGEAQKDVIRVSDECSVSQPQGASRHRSSGGHVADRGSVSQPPRAAKGRDPPPTISVTLHDIKQTKQQGFVNDRKTSRNSKTRFAVGPGVSTRPNKPSLSVTSPRDLQTSSLTAPVAGRTWLPSSSTKEKTSSVRSQTDRNTSSVTSSTGRKTSSVMLPTHRTASSMSSSTVTSSLSVTSSTDRKTSLSMVSSIDRKMSSGTSSDRKTSSVTLPTSSASASAGGSYLTADRDTSVKTKGTTSPHTSSRAKAASVTRSSMQSGLATSRVFSKSVSIANRVFVAVGVEQSHPVSENQKVTNTVNTSTSKGAGLWRLNRERWC